MTIDTAIDTWATEDPVSAEGRQMYDRLWNKGILVQIQGGVWSMEAKLTAKDIGLDGNEIPEFISLGKKRLLPTAEKNRFHNYVSRARNQAERLGFPFFITGSYFIPFANFDRLKDLLEKEKDGFYDTVDAFIERYDDRRDAFLEANDKFREILEVHYPPAGEVRSKFSFQIIYFMASLSSSVTNDASGEELYVNWAVQAVNSLRDEARTAADAIQTAVTDGTLDGRTMRRVQTLIDRLTNMDLTGDADLRSAAFAVVSNPSTATASALKSAATAVSLDDVRAVVLD